MCFLCSGFYF